ncbi:MAG: DUF4270 family protein [Chitinophagales bacterium]|nr:DUF4270 family protein [Chitinophagales bacterium]
MKQRYSFNTGILIIALGLLLSTGCKEDTIVKSNITPGDNYLGTQSVGDTMTVITKTFLVDKYKTSEKISGLPVIFGLGTIVDPFFGKTNAGIYFQVLPTVNSFSFSSGGYHVDSAVLIMPFSGFAWGNRTDPKPQKYRVYRVEEPMSIDNDYYSNQDLQVNSTLLGEATIDLQKSITDTPYVIDGKAGFKHLRIPLSQAFIDDVTSNIGDDKHVYNTEAEFLAHFNGFYVAPDSATNMANNTDLIPYIVLDGGSDYSNAAVAFYYREDSNPTITKVAFFNYRRESNVEKTAAYSHISRNYSGYPAETFINRYNSTINISDDTLLLQHEPGVCIDIRVPYISNLPVASIIKAEIVLTKISSGVDADSLLTPSRLIPVGVNEDGSEYEILDFISSDITAAVQYIDGLKRTEKDSQGNDITTYRINVPRELQNAIIDKRNELHLRIKGSKGFPGAYRLVAGGRGHSTYKMQLNIVYAKPN